MTTSFSLTIDYADADQMMEFWTTALGYKSKDPPEGFDDWCSYFRQEVPEGKVPEGRVEVRALDRDGVS